MDNILEQLIADKDKAEKALLNYNDGFIYVVKVYSYGSAYFDTYTNSYSAAQRANAYNGDNGSATIYTNNSEISNLIRYPWIKYLSWSVVDNPMKFANNSFGNN